MLISPCPVIERPGVHTELSGDGAGVLGRVTVHAGQEAFDSFARPLETEVRNCELAVRSGGSARRGNPSWQQGVIGQNLGRACGR